ncbi:hypothetical protein MMC25_007970 [Agyrium rufum]|nr:hypothetical protein [Agyrium rufum]
MTRALAQNGATVYILGRRLPKLEEAAASCANFLPGRVIPIECDVTSKPALEAAAARIASEIGYVNLVIANAGIMGPTYNSLAPRLENDPKGPVTIQEVQSELWRNSVEDFTDVYRVNVAGPLYTAVAFLDLLDRGNRQGNVKQTSQVLVTSSIGAFHRSWVQGGLAYTTSKAAVNHMVKGLASFLVQWKIRVNGLAPGIFPSEMSRAALGNDSDLTIEGALPKTVQPLGRAGRDEEIGGTVLYLASEAGGYCSGTIHVLDGGRLGLQPGATY